MTLASKKSTIADQINNLINDERQNFESDDEAEETKAKVVDKFDESDTDDDINLSSSIRKKNVKLLDEFDDRYKGKKVSRTDIYENLSSPEESEDDDEGSESENDNSKEFQDDEDEDASQDYDDNDDDEEVKDDEESADKTLDDDDSCSDDNEVDEDNPLYRNRAKNEIKSMTDSNSRANIEKGHCVRRQLKIWENLLEMRIQLQKCLISSNKLPQFDVYPDFLVHKKFTDSKKTVTNKLTNLLDSLLEVQDKLLKNNPETKNLFNEKNQKEEDKDEPEEDSMDEEICSDTEEEEEEEEKLEKDNDELEEDEENKSNEPPKKKQKRTLEDYEKILKEKHEKFTPYRNSVIQKWNDKTRIASGKINKSTSQPIVKQIEFIMSNKSKIIRKTQLKRSDYEVISKKIKEQINDNDKIEQEYDTEIYDDDDFYHQLLRDLIEHKSADITDPVQLSKQWIQLQNLRNKMKKKVDTKASKGRRIRYNIHQKLVNFMTQRTFNDTWSDLAKTELYNSLFGKIKIVENNLNEINEN